MGVHGLWQLISSTGKPVPLESLEGKVLAVDVSVWLHQLSKGMRDGAGNPVPNAHLHGLFTRICKLIHCRIKPVFVFDGGVPALKKQTLANRKSRRDDAEKSSELMQQKILTNLIRSQVLQAAAGDASGPIGPYYTKSKSKTDKDTLFQLPPIPETSKTYLNENLHQEDAFVERRELQAMIEEEYEDVNQINVDSDEFKSLPSELQHEIIYDIQQNRKNYNMSKIAELPSDSNDFSSYQLSKVLKHSKLHSRLEEVRREMNNRQTQDLSKHYNYDLRGMDAQSHRLVSDERSHVLLIKGLKNKQNDPEVEEKKRKQEIAKREKNMKLLEKVFPEMSGITNNIEGHTQNQENIKYNDSIKVEQTELNEGKLSGERGLINVIGNENCETDNDTEDKENIVILNRKGRNLSVCDAEVTPLSIESDDIRKKLEHRPADINSHRTNRVNVMIPGKPRYRPVIEVETDSSDEEGEADVLGGGSVMAEGFTERTIDDDTIVIEDDGIDSEDEQMQMAIALSLQQTTTNEDRHDDDFNDDADKHRNKTDDGRHDGRHDVMHDDALNDDVDQHRNKEFRDTDVKTSLGKSVRNNDEITFQEKSSSNEQELLSKPPENNSKQGKFDTGLTKKKKKHSFHEQQKSLRSSTQRNVGLQALVPLQSKGACKFKRQISNLSNPDIDDEPVPRKIIRTESEDSNLPDEDVEIMEDAKDDPVEVSEDSEDDFIEVKIDPTKVAEDDLFPSSMFTPVVDNERVDSCLTEQEREAGLTEGREVGETSDTESVEHIADITNIQHRNTQPSDDREKGLHEEITESPHGDGETQPHVVDNTKDKPLYTETADNSPLDEDMENNHQALDKETNPTNKPNPTESEVNDIADKTDAITENIDDSDGVVLSQESQMSLESHLVSESGESIEDAPASPKVPDLVREFQDMDERNIRGLRDGLAKEGRQLQLERGKQERLAMSITDQMHTEAQELLRLFGIPYIVSPTEAEAQCAQLDYSKQTQGTITDDSDIWLFGGKCVYKNFFNQQKYVECFRLESIQNKLGLTRQALINIALLCGSDYTHGIQGVGPVTAMEILAEFPGDGIEGLNKFRSWWDTAQKEIKFKTANKLRAKLRELELNEGFPQPQVVDAYLNPVVDDSSEKLTWGIPDLDQLRHFAVDKLGWTREKVDETLEPVLKRINDKQNQMRISAFFQPEVHMQPAKMKSKRLQNVVTKFLNPDSTADSDRPENVDKNIEKAKTDKQKRTRTTAKKKKNTNGEDNEISTEFLENIENTDDIQVIKSSSKNATSKLRNKSKGTKGSGVTGKITENRVSDVKDKRNLRSKATSVQYVEQSDSSVTTDSESDSATDSDGDSDVVKASLDVLEILGMNIGPNTKTHDEEDKEDSEETVGEKVFVTGLHLDEIMNLKSGDKDTLVEEKDENILEKWDIGLQGDEDLSGKTNKDTSNNQNIPGSTVKLDAESEEVDFTNEGGFCKEDSDNDQEESNTNQKPNTELLTNTTNSRSGKRKVAEVVVVPEEERRSKRQTRSTVRYSDSSDNSLGVKQGKKQDTRPNKSRKCDDKESHTVNVKLEKQDGVIIDTSVLESKHLTEVHGMDPELKKEIPVYASNPMKRLLTGVPWEKRAAKRGRMSKGPGKGKSLQVEPKEKLLQRKKEIQKQTRKPVGVVNLSESSSDSN